MAGFSVKQCVIARQNTRLDSISRQLKELCTTENYNPSTCLQALSNHVFCLVLARYLAEKPARWLSLESRELARDKEKYGRAMLPENNQNVLKGRRILAHLVHKLGGENNDVTFQAIGQEYALEYNRVFNEDERRKYFCRGNVSRILDDYCYEDLILKRQDPNGERYIRLRRPYSEICAELKRAGLNNSPETTIDGPRQSRNEVG
ncbi:hypothetical protein Ddc_15911 [Ditylenchus destructor]|nr:hypothetical protein Ddc_15911 [Ditylenchus destructor]